MSDDIKNIYENNGVAMGANNGVMNFNAPSTRESELRKILDIMLSVDIVEVEGISLSDYDTEDYEIDGKNGKIQYNSLQGDWLEVIYDYPSFAYIINDALTDGENGISQKSKFLMQLKFYYRKAKTDLAIPIGSQEAICSKSSEILDRVKMYHMDFLKDNGEVKEHYDENYIHMLVAFGFIECKILEKPKSI